MITYAQHGRGFYLKSTDRGLNLETSHFSEPPKSLFLHYLITDMY